MIFFAKYFTLTFLINSIPYILMAMIIKYYYGKIRLFMLGSKLPGPKPWPIIGNALDLLPKDVVIFRKITELNRKYGLMAHWLGHRLNVYICSPEDAEMCLKSPYLRDKDDSYRFFEPLLGKGLVTANGIQHDKARKLMEPAFSHLAVQAYLGVYNKKVEIMLQCLQKEEGNQSFYIYPYIKTCIYDILREALLSVPSHAQTVPSKPLEHAEVVASCINERMFTIWQQFDFIYRLSAKGKDFYRRIECSKKLSQPSIEDLRIIYNKRKDVLSEGNDEQMARKHLLLKNLMQLKNDEIRDQVLTIFAAGFESTSLTTSFVLIMLGIHKDVQEKLYEEVSTAFKNGLAEKDLYRLQYLEMVIKETLRLYPPPFVFREASQDVQIGQHLIPQGASVIINIFAIHRNPKEYDKPDAFNPDNFLPENVEKRHPCSYIPFLKGSRNCIGSKFAMMALRIIISKIVFKYKIECDLKIEDIKVKDRVFLQPENGYIRIIKR